MSQIIMAGHNFNEEGWDSNMRIVADAASKGRVNLTLGLLDMANRVEFITSHRMADDHHEPPWLS